MRQLERSENQRCLAKGQQAWNVGEFCATLESLHLDDLEVRQRDHHRSGCDHSLAGRARYVESGDQARMCVDRTNCGYLAGQVPLNGSCFSHG